ncbi:hypothetical protein PRIPAC_98116, partial [Pristionchus pacificus]|uniref:Uncharacterized protein n=1 Tax=Pristionchus pacificus TaxID=54126 RepID=A0A2A6BZ09_PRIPA
MPLKIACGFTWISFIFCFIFYFAIAALFTSKRRGSSKDTAQSIYLTGGRVVNMHPSETLSALVYSDGMDMHPVQSQSWQECSSSQ